MSAIEVKISQKNAELTAIVKNGESDSLPSFILNLQKAKEETNEFLSGLVEQEKQHVLQKPKEATKRKLSETLEDDNGAKKSAVCSDNEDNADDDNGSNDDEDEAV